MPRPSLFRYELIVTLFPAGAIIHGLNLTQPLDELTQEQLKETLYKYRVIFLRNQHVNPTNQVAFARIFGLCDDPSARPGLILTRHTDTCASAARRP
jgi:taurine dioxygenase